MRYYNPSTSGVALTQSHPMEHMNIEHYKVRALWNADGDPNSNMAEGFNAYGSDGFYNAVGNSSRSGYWNAEAKRCTPEMEYFGFCTRKKAGSLNAEGFYNGQGPYSEGFYNAGGEQFKSFIGNLFPNAAGRGAAKNEERLAQAQLDAAIAAKLQQQSDPNASRTEGAGVGKKVLIGLGAAAAVGLLIVIIVKIKKNNAGGK